MGRILNVGVSEGWVRSLHTNWGAKSVRSHRMEHLETESIPNVSHGVGREKSFLSEPAVSALLSSRPAPTGIVGRLIFVLRMLMPCCHPVTSHRAASPVSVPTPRVLLWDQDGALLWWPGPDPWWGGSGTWCPHRCHLWGPFPGRWCHGCPLARNPSPQVAALNESCFSCRLVLPALPPGLQGGTGGFVPLDT